MLRNTLLLIPLLPLATAHVPPEKDAVNDIPNVYAFVGTDIGYKWDDQDLDRICKKIFEFYWKNGPPTGCEVKASNIIKDEAGVSVF